MSMNKEAPLSARVAHLAVLRDLRHRCVLVLFHDVLHIVALEVVAELAEKSHWLERNIESVLGTYATTSQLHCT